MERAFRIKQIVLIAENICENRMRRSLKERCDLLFFLLVGSLFMIGAGYAVLQNKYIQGGQFFFQLVQTCGEPFPPGEDLQSPLIQADQVLVHFPCG